MNPALTLLMCSGLIATGVACRASASPDRLAPVPFCALPDTAASRLLSSARSAATDTSAVGEGIRRVLHPEVELGMSTAVVRDEGVCAAIANALGGGSSDAPVHVVAVGPYFWARPAASRSDAYYVFDATAKLISAVNVR